LSHRWRFVVRSRAGTCPRQTQSALWSRSTPSKPSKPDSTLVKRLFAETSARWGLSAVGVPTPLSPAFLPRAPHDCWSRQTLIASALAQHPALWIGQTDFLAQHETGSGVDPSLPSPLQLPLVHFCRREGHAGCLLSQAMQATDKLLGSLLESGQSQRPRGRCLLRSLPLPPHNPFTTNGACCLRKSRRQTTGRWALAIISWPRLHANAKWCPASHAHSLAVMGTDGFACGGGTPPPSSVVAPASISWW